MRLIEHYLSVQGEGLHPGQLTYFVRFAQCNLRCAWCDSSNSFGEGNEIGFDAVAKAITQSHARLVCLTGGEPLLHLSDCVKLMQGFPNLHFDIETNGSLDIQSVQTDHSSVILDWKLKHSGMSEKMRSENLALLRPSHDLLKLVTDGSAEEKKEIEEIVQKTESLIFPISLQPIFGTDPQKLTEWCLSLKNPRVRINLQLHKYIWGGKKEKT